MRPRAYVEVNLGAIAANIKQIASKTDAQILAVVKADAYGHGLVPVAHAAVTAGASWLGVALLEEAITLRSKGITAPIIAWLTPPGDDFALALQEQIDLSISSLALLQEVHSAGIESGIKPRVHIEVDTGMRRGGFLAEWRELLGALETMKSDLQIVGLWSHFARSDEPESDFSELQLKTFAQYERDLSAIGIVPEITHLSNSAAALRLPTAHRSLVRVGIGMYGLSPDVERMGTSSELGLQPAMKVFAKLVNVKFAEKGSAVGYGGTAILEDDTHLGIVAMGYADGLPRSATSEAGASTHEMRAPLVGRVSMDQCVIDCGESPTVSAGDYVEVIGGVFSIDDWARASGTINYEIVTRIAPRLPRIYID
jgi:alanine racemase